MFYIPIRSLAVVIKCDSITNLQRIIAHRIFDLLTYVLIKLMQIVAFERGNLMTLANRTIVITKSSYYLVRVLNNPQRYPMISLGMVARVW